MIPGIVDAISGKQHHRQKMIVCSLLFMFIILLFSFCFLAYAGRARADVLPDWFTADFLENLDTRDGATFMTSGSAYIEPMQGLRVNESGVNHLIDPSFESGGIGWQVTGSATASAYSGDAFSGNSSLLLNADDDTSDFRIYSDTGGIDLSQLQDDNYFTFSVYLKSTTGGLENVMLFFEGETTGLQLAGPFHVGPEWQRFAVTSVGDSFFVAGIIPGSAAATPVGLLADAAQLEGRSFDTTYFDGDQLGSLWSSSPHSSTSVREGGRAHIGNNDLALDFTQPFWFALDMTLGFDRTDTWGTYPIGSKDFLNIGTPSGTGYGMAGNEGVILDYYSATGKFSFSKINRRGSVSYPAPSFQAGDPIRAVCAYDPSTGMEMWVRLGANDLTHITDLSAAAKQPAQIGESWMLSVSDCQAWSSYGDYQSNSLHRNLVVSQGSINESMAAEYIEDPLSFVAECKSRPFLDVRSTRIYWTSMEDYVARILSVDYSIDNIGSGPAYNIRVTGGDCTNGVMPASTAPVLIEELTSGVGSSQFTFQYVVPHGVQTFRTSNYAQALDVCGFNHYYPDDAAHPPPAS